MLNIMVRGPQRERERERERGGERGGRERGERWREEKEREMCLFHERIKVKVTIYF